MVYTVDMSGELPHSITSSSPHIYCRQVYLLLSEAIEVLISFYFASTFATRPYQAQSSWLCWAERGCFRSVQRLWREDILRSDKQPFMSCGILSHRPMMIRRGFLWWYYKGFLNCLCFCVTRAPLLYFIRSWVALSFKVVSQSVRHR